MSDYYVSLKAFKKDPTKFSRNQIGDMCYHQKLSEKFMWDMRKYLNWYAICNNRQITLRPEFIEKVKDYIDWDTITWKFGDTWDEDFIREHKDYIHWENLCRRKNLSEEFVTEMYDYIPFTALLPNQMKNYSEQFLRTVLLADPKLINTVLMMTEFNLSLDFIRELKDYLDANRLTHSINIPQNNKIIDEFKFDFTARSWYDFLKEKDVDIHLLLRFKEQVYWDNTYFVEWYIEGQENKDEEANKQIREYMAWVRLKNGFSRNSSKATC